MLEDTGECSIADIDEMNIPINCFISEAGIGWVFTANNFMPRKNRATEGAYEITAKTREELVQMVNEKIVPLYEAALSNLKQFGQNYYWEKQNPT